VSPTLPLPSVTEPLETQPEPSTVIESPPDKEGDSITEKLTAERNEPIDEEWIDAVSKKEGRKSKR